jgi:hypothetical protein
MRKILGMAVGTAIALAVTAASAQSVEGTIEAMDPLAKSITVDGKIYQMPEAMTAGTDFDDLKVGDKVDIHYNPEDGSDEDSRYQAMQVEKIKE